MVNGQQKSWLFKIFQHGNKNLVKHRGKDNKISLFLMNSYKFFPDYWKLYEALRKKLIFYSEAFFLKLSIYSTNWSHGTKKKQKELLKLRL